MADPDPDLKPRRLCVVSSQAFLCAEFVTALRTALRPGDELEIVVDRRRDRLPAGARSDPAAQPSIDRRHHDVAPILKMAGFAIVPALVTASTERGAERPPLASTAPPTERLSRDDSAEDRRELERTSSFQRRPQLGEERLARDDSAEDRLKLERFRDFKRRQEVGGEHLVRDESDEDGRELERILSFQRRQEVRVGSWLILTALLAASLVLIVQLPAVKTFLARARPAQPPSTSEHVAVPPGNQQGAVPPSDRQAAETAEDQQPAVPQAQSVAEPRSETTRAPAMPQAVGPQRAEPARPREARPEPSAVPGPSPGTGPAASVGVASAPIREIANPRFPGLPRVEVVRDTAQASEGRGEAYAVRISDTAGKPLAGAEVLLLARMADGTVENIPLGSGPEPGSYHGSAPAGRSTPVDIRVRVVTNDKRVEIPLRP